MEFIDILLFYCLKAMESNRKTMKTIEIVKRFPIDVTPIKTKVLAKFQVYLLSFSHLFQVFVTITVF